MVKNWWRGWNSEFKFSRIHTLKLAVNLHGGGSTRKMENFHCTKSFVLKFSGNLLIAILESFDTFVQRISAIVKVKFSCCGMNHIVWLLPYRDFVPPYAFNKQAMKSFLFLSFIEIMHFIILYYHHHQKTTYHMQKCHRLNMLLNIWLKKYRPGQNS